MDSQVWRHKFRRSIVVEVSVGVAIVGGLIVAALSTTAPMEANIRGTIGLSHSSIYVGANTCFTCHDDQPHEWSPATVALSGRTTFVRPRVPISMDGDSASVRMVDAGDSVDAYTVDSSPAETALQNLTRLNYVVKTEDGVTYPLNRWDVTTSDVEAAT